MATLLETFFPKFKATSGQEVYALFEQCKTDGVDVYKWNHLLMQKSKSFYELEQKKMLRINVAGLVFTKDEAISG